MTSRVSSSGSPRKKLGSPTGDSSPSGAKEKSSSSHSSRQQLSGSRPPSNGVPTNQTTTSTDERPSKVVGGGVKRTVSASKLLRKKSMSNVDDAHPQQQQQQQQQQPAPSSRGVSRRFSSELQRKPNVETTDGGAAAGAVEYKEVIVNGVKKVVKVKKKSAADVAAEGTGENTHRKLVKVKVVKKPNSSTNVSSNNNNATGTGQTSQPPDSVSIRVGIPANHQLRRPQAPVRTQSSDASGVWSRAARSLFSLQEKRSKASDAPDEDVVIVDLPYQPPENVDQTNLEPADQGLNKSGHSRGSRSKTSTYKPPTQLNGEPGIDTKSKGSRKEGQSRSAFEPSRKTPIKTEQQEKYDEADEFGDPELNAFPVLEINTNANITRTKTKSIFQSESMLRRQFIQDQWLSGGSNYVVWEQAAQKKLTDSAHTRNTDYTSAESCSISLSVDDEFADDVSEITCEELVPPMLLVQPQNSKTESESDRWEALCAHRIHRFGARSALTAEAFVNRGIAQLHANKLDDAADSLLSAVCFLEEVHGTMESYNNQNTSSSASHMHMAQAFFLLGKVYMQQEQYPMAESAFYKALNIRQVHLGKSHPDTMECWEQLALSYAQRSERTPRGRSAKAAAALEAAVAVQRQAMEILTQVLKLKRAIFGSAHVSVARTARIVARLCAIQNQEERAQRLYKQVIHVLQLLDSQETAQINPEFPDPQDAVLQRQRKEELTDIEEEMERFGIKDVMLEI